MRTTSGSAARIRGGLDDGALERSIQAVARRHAALRTAFAAEDDAVVQVIADEISLPLERIDLSEGADPEAELRRRTDEFASRPFDLDRPPLIRAYLLRVGPDDHVLQLVLHHTICDGWSHVVILRELAALYEAQVARQRTATSLHREFSTPNTPERQREQTPGRCARGRGRAMGRAA